MFTLMENEIWKDIPGTPGYQASSLGRIRSINVLSLTPEKATGYVRASVLKNKGPKENDRVFVHGLVARAFIGPKPEGLQVNHINGKRADNRIENLEYIKPVENVRHAFKLGNRARYFTEAEMDRMADWFIDDGLSVTEIARRLIREGSTAKFENLRGKVRKVLSLWRKDRRIAAGKEMPGSKWINAEQADKMRDLYATGKMSQRELAKLFSCSSGTVCRIVNETGARKEDRRGKHSKGNPNFGKWVNELNAAAKLSS